jgi:hypothetical protein
MNAKFVFTLLNIFAKKQQGIYLTGIEKDKYIVEVVIYPAGVNSTSHVICYAIIWLRWHFVSC